MAHTGALCKYARMALLTESGEVPGWTISDRLRKAREMNGLNQAELAAELGISSTSVGNYESGRRTPRRPVLTVWALRCGVPLSWLLEGDVEALPRVGSNHQPAGNDRDPGLVILAA